MSETRESAADKVGHEVDILHFVEHWMQEQPQEAKRVATEHLKPQLGDKLLKGALAEFGQRVILAWTREAMPS